MFRVLVLLCLSGPAFAGQAMVATVDGVGIPRSLFQMYVRNGVEELAADPKRVEQAVLEELIDRTLIESEAERRGLLADAQLLADGKRTWVTRLGGEAAYRQYLADHSITEADFLRIVRQDIASTALAQALTREVRIADADIVAFYDRERANTAFAELFIEPETATAAHILIAARRPLSDNEIASRRARAMAIRREAISGADFAALARRHSDDAGTRPRGGDLGRFARGSHVESFDKAVFAMPPGGISAVIETEYGFHVIHLVARSPRHTRSLDQARAGIEQHLLATRSAEHLRQWLGHRRRSAVINGGF